MRCCYTLFVYKITWTNGRYCSLYYFFLFLRGGGRSMVLGLEF